jgi:hypothetical protein
LLFNFKSCIFERFKILKKSKNNSMKNIYKIVLLFAAFIVVSNAHAQSVYDNYRDPDSKGRRLEVYGSNLLDFNHFQDVNGDTITSLNLNLRADYRQWRFTQSMLVGGYVNTGVNYNSHKHNSGNSIGRTDFDAVTYGAASYYFSPNQFYVSGALGLSYATFSQDTGSTTIGSVSRNEGPGYLWGNLGYGRIYNAGRVKDAINIEDAMRQGGVITGTLPNSVTVAIARLVAQRDNGDFDAASHDDQDIQFFNALQSLLQRDGIVSGDFTMAQTIRIYEALNNTRGRYVNYPRYIGYQAQVQAQYQIFNQTKNKTHDHHLAFDAVFGKALSNNTSFLLSGFFGMALDSLATGLAPSAGFGGPGSFQSYLPFIPDLNNLDFFVRTDGTGLYKIGYVGGKDKFFGARGDIFHSINNRAGIRGAVEFTSLSFNQSGRDPRSTIAAEVRLDYNITHWLRSFIQAGLTKVSGNKTAPFFDDRDIEYNASIGFTWRVLGNN